MASAHPAGAQGTHQPTASTTLHPPDFLPPLPPPRLPSRLQIHADRAGMDYDYANLAAAMDSGDDSDAGSEEGDGEGASGSDAEAASDDEEAGGSGNEEDGSDVSAGACGGGQHKGSLHLCLCLLGLMGPGAAATARWPGFAHCSLLYSSSAAP